MASQKGAIAGKRSLLEGKSVIITGNIFALDRKAAEKILKDAGAKIEKSLNKKVQMVVLGRDAGPSKLEKIKALGIETKDFYDLVSHGEDDVEDDGGNGTIEGKTGEDDSDEEMGVSEDGKTEKEPKISESKADTQTKPAPGPLFDIKPEVCFVQGKVVIITGTIPGHDRRSAQRLVEEAGASVARSLNKQVEVAILGTSPGPDKLKKIKELGIQTVEWAEFAAKHDIEIQPEKQVADVSTGEAPNSLDGRTVIITGTIEGQTRAAAQKLLESAGAKFAKSLNKSVELVILGENPGPEKLNKIAELGIDTCSFSALVEKLDFDVDQPPKKKAKRN